MTMTQYEPVTEDRFRRVLSHFCTGVVVVTGGGESGPAGFTCQSFSALSLDPPLVLFTAGRRSTSWPRIRPTGHFAVNILAAGQSALSTAFARSDTDKFADVAWRPGTAGPLLNGAIAHIECAVEDVHEAGDHQIVIGRVLALNEGHGGEPLLYFRSGYRSLHRQEPA
ncbi:flavin reductase [Actinomadura sp. LD22]|uniref:Flavin reductase n=1 Tax=Actinomadura physcomitrii TaxID=2650748 RepID=A0A6I4MLD5_9ACTN|nr:flavin reductase family protein [Actinomadura physcomitrii]MWA05425.1 flavin reductase [Actinomadura physcomitrii]